MAYSALLFVTNIHCPSCVTHAQDVLRDIPGLNSVDVSVIDHTIRVQYDGDRTNEAVISNLLDAAFEVQHVTITDDRGNQIRSYDIDPTPSKPPRWSLLMSRAQRKHIENCKSCQNDRKIKSKTSKTWAGVVRARRRSGTDRLTGSENNSTRTVAPDQPMTIEIDRIPEEDETDNGLHSAMISIGGMTCVSCVGTISRELENQDYVESVDVNLVANNAKVTFRGPKDNIDKILETIDDVGYDATLDELHTVSEQAKTSSFRASLSVSGMTCGSCVGTITRGLNELPFISSVNVDLVGNSAMVEFEGKEKIEAILEKLDDLGYDATVVKVDELAKDLKSDAIPERTVQIRIDGMYCDHCPGKVMSALHRATDDLSPGFAITKEPTTKDPIVTVTYRPSPPILTVRRFISIINEAQDVFSATVYHPPTIEERSRKIRHKEQIHILMRLIFTAIVAIPTFIIGVVYMSLVPESNLTRQWFEEPIFGGNAMRLEWALFFMTLPVMFFGSDIFHVRAFKEIRSMWRRKSKVPLITRFYRFGSMNLLISAGTLVAFLASLAILIMNATTNPSTSNHFRSSNTYFDTVTFLSFFILIGRFLEAYSKAKSGDAVTMLSKLRPSEALLVEKSVIGTESIIKVPVDNLEVGDVVQIPHGSSPPTDGRLDQDGTFLFDESSLTGESKPVKKTHGDTVYTGSVNVGQPVKIEVTEMGTSMLDQIVNVVREGQAHRAPIERLADILTGYFVPVITLVAILTWLIWLGLGQTGKLPQAWLDVEKGGWPFWSLEFAIAVFVVACPCGIGLAAPTALFVGGGLAAKQGILVQGGGEAFQEASKLKTIVFDKTGTLTEGQMRVTDFELLQGTSSDDKHYDEKIIRGLSRAMEESSTHPIAKAISEYCREDAIDIINSDIQEVPGQGMTGKFTVKVEDSEIQYEAAIGNERLLDALKSTHSKSEKTGITNSEATEKTVDFNFYLSPILRKHQSLGHSTSIFALREILKDNQINSKNEFRALALFSIADPIRQEAPLTLKELRKSGVDVHMCTGDNQTTAHAIASQLEIPVSNVRAGVLPQDKAAYIQELQNLDSRGKGNRRIVAFVGDGTNDTPALSAADVSIALASGSDVAVTTASFILLNSDLNTILALVRLSKRVFLRVKLNFAWAAVYNICLVPVAAGIFFSIGANNDHGGWRLGPVWASCAMAASSVSVVLSSLALRLPEVRF